MTKALVIVESPAKAGTIKRYLGKGYQVLASYGHVRDLIPKTGAVDVEGDFAMAYEPIDRNRKHVDAIVKAAKGMDTILLATDPDREGEAIAWHVLALLQERKALKEQAIQRVVFHQITKKAIQEAIAQPRELSMPLVNAQQARRALDYLVGFHLSPLLWKKIRRGLSAGRVQSPALRLIVERELEIEAFVSQEYWTIHAHCQTPKPFEAKLTHYHNNKLDTYDIPDEDRATAIRDDLSQQSNGRLTVHTVEKKQRKRRPSPPFITSTMQQEAVRKLGFTTSRTMRIAQQLYEGIDLGGHEGRVGLITYMRTDSVAMADEAIAQARAVIGKHYGADYLPKEPQTYRTKSKNAQEAHEAIRPSSFEKHPDDLASMLTPEQLKLYRMIFQRALASQMKHALLDTIAVTLAAPTPDVGLFRATGSSVKHPGFLAAYQAGRDEDQKQDDDEKWLPDLKEGQQIELQNIEGLQHFTEPPPRYSEASLVKALEEFGIGRPSTYASIIATLQQREYVEWIKKRFHPTDVGRIVNQFLTEHFTRYVDYDFTAGLEDDLDSVSRDEQSWIDLLKQFWQPFEKQVETIEANVKRSDVTSEDIDEACPQCGGALKIRLGRRGRFIGCSQYPECNYTRDVDQKEGEEEEQEELPDLDRACPECQEPLIIKRGRYGKFIGCSGYPKCKHIEPLEKPKSTGVTCPECHKGQIVQKRSRRGKLFYACDQYPTCKYAVWNEPVNKVCPSCRWPMLTIKTTKKNGTEWVCPQKNCDYTEQAPAESE